LSVFDGRPRTWTYWLTQISLWGVAVPLLLFCWWAYLQAPRHLPDLRKVQQVEVWHEPLGQPVFDQPTLERLVTTPPDWTRAQWKPVTLPYTRTLDAAVALPPDAPKERLWVRIALDSGAADRGRLGVLGARVMAGGPWALWVDGQLQQANVADWRIQLNVPLRASIPLGAKHVLVAFPYAMPQGFAVGSFFLGPVDKVDKAWQELNFWFTDLPRFMTGLGLLLMLSSAHLAWARRRERAYRILAFDALAWATCCFQYFFDPTGQDEISRWLWSAVDSATTWAVVLGLVFAFDVLSVRMPRARAGLIVYAALSTLLTLPFWKWDMNGLLGLHYVNVAVVFSGIAVLGVRVTRKPTREGVAILGALLVQMGLGVHTLQNLTNQSNPDSVFLFPIGTFILYSAFSYVVGRRTVTALAVSEHHEQVLRERLDEQERHLAEQHALLQRLEVERRLAGQHETIMQDLHDRLGSNLTSALLQARAGGLSSQETVLLLQDLADELRHIGKSTARDTRSLNQILAELRQRVQHRLGHGGIALEWDVDPALPPMPDRETGQHVRALLSEAIANVIKHAGASQIQVLARQDGGQVLIEVNDNGGGFVPDHVEPGRGLPGMQQRARDLGGKLSVESAPGQGCRWRLRLPVAVG
jgi:signal transduction histidine kinase